MELYKTMPGKFGHFTVQLQLSFSLQLRQIQVRFSTTAKREKNPLHPQPYQQKSRRGYHLTICVINTATKLAKSMN